MGKRMLEAVWGTVFIFTFLYLFTFVPSFDHLDPISDALRDYESSDQVFSSMKDSMHADFDMDTNITIVNIAQVDRATIGKMLEIIGKYKPKVVGIDAFFRKEKGPMQDFPLMMGMSKIENLVLVSELDSVTDEGNCWKRLNKSNPMFMDYAMTGFANVITGEHEHGGDYRTVREFRPTFCIADSLELNFTTKIVSIFDSAAYRNLLTRGNNSEAINWRGNFTKFFSLGVNQVLQEQFDPSVVRDKIILFGYIGEYVGDQDSYIDKFYTPMNERAAGRSYPDMYGIVVHANVISMILHGNYITTLPDWADYLICLIVTYLNVLLFMFIARNRKTWYDVITKPMQIVELIVITFLVIGFLLNYNIKMNLTLTLITIAFAGDLTELFHSTIMGFAQKQIDKARSFIQSS
jgi:CHASE2 domain-containing sensor protein